MSSGAKSSSVCGRRAGQKPAKEVMRNEPCRALGLAERSYLVPENLFRDGGEERGTVNAGSRGREVTPFLAQAGTVSHHT